MDEKGVHDVERDASIWLARRNARRHRLLPIFVLGLLTFFALGTHVHLTQNSYGTVRIPVNASQIQARCENLKLKPGPPSTFSNRTSSDRFALGSKPTLIRNATIWTGRTNGLEIIEGDILLDTGIIKAVGTVEEALLQQLDHAVEIIDADGAWITPGIVDLHSHLGLLSAPKLNGASDGNSRKGIAQPWLRSLDALNTHDDSFRLTVAGGVTTALVLPGSANDIGGQAFAIKLRDTAEHSPSSMLLEPPFTLNSSDAIDWSLPPRWRQMKHACGENPRRVYGNSRMDNLWTFREVYDKARQIKEKQDAYCAKALNNERAELGAFPEELQWEALIDVLRGRVKVQVHCYEAVDLDDIVRLTNEFKFPIATFHHAHETYLVPDLLKKAYGNTPAAAIFATNARYKREAYRGSEFAPKILAQNGIQVVMKSDHPVLNSRYLLYEAQQAHYYGLPENVALASVTTTPAQAMGMDHRIGFIKEGFDADLVIWDSHPLALGATPKQVFIDGVVQLASPFTVEKPESIQKAPKTPDFDDEAADAVKYDGLPPLAPEKSIAGTVVFLNVKSITIRASQDNGLVHAFEAQGSELGLLAVERGKVTCMGNQSTCASFLEALDAQVVDLKGGTISPGLISFGSPLGLEEIHGEVSTRDGSVYDPLEKTIPSVIGGEGTLIRAADGLQFATRNALLAYRSGVTVGVTAPTHDGFFGGLSTAFGLGAAHKLESDALVQEVAAVHVAIGHSGSSASVSTQIAALRRLLLEPAPGDVGMWFKSGESTLVVEAQSMDVISTILLLKKEVELETGVPVRLTIAGAAEAHLIAKQLADANVGVVVSPSRPFPATWESRRILPGPPLTRDSAISLLLAHNVTVGIGIEESWSARNTRFDAAWAALESFGSITKTQALELVSSNLETLLGLNVDPELTDLVATETGDIFDFEGKVVGIISPRKGAVNLF
ncbi:composite domain of metallo-dependent hydrolase [Phellopilus nigrolimitatus]|nr:composite domain of metallo-dependent hydrolase [Phellopilus nigrolimitatus]